MSNATQAVVDGKMEPIAKSEPGQQLVVTGQYLHDTFCAVSEEAKTRMDAIRGLVGKADALQMKGACDAMVKLAVALDYPEGKPKKADRLAKEQSAMNARTIILSAWGALEYASETLTAIGYTDNTGYQEMRVLAKKALETAGIKWDGERLATDAEKAVAALKRDQKAETDALVKVQQDNPRAVGETLADWNTRTFALAETAMQSARADKTAETVAKIVGSLVEKYDANTLFQIAEELMSVCGFSVAEPESEETIVDETVDESVTA